MLENELVQPAVNQMLGGLGDRNSAVTELVAGQNLRQYCSGSMFAPDVQSESGSHGPLRSRGMWTLPNQQELRPSSPSGPLVVAPPLTCASGGAVSAAGPGVRETRH